MIINHLGGLQTVSFERNILYIQYFAVLLLCACVCVCVAMLPYLCLIAEDFLCCHGILLK